MTNDMPDRPSPPPAATRRIPLAIGAVLIGAVIGFAGVYGVAGLTMATVPLRLPDLAFEDTDGKPKKLSDWRGRTVLVNLWATWCVPCRKEMPALESLQTRLGGADLDRKSTRLN